MASLEEVQQLVDAIGLNGDPSKADEIADALRSLPVFARVEVENGVVHAQFTDGEFLVVMNNRPNNYPDSSAPRIRKPDLGTGRPNPISNDRRREKNAEAPRSALEKKTLAPESNKAVLINAMGTAYCDLTPALGAWLDGANYAVTRLGGSIEEMRTGVTNAGVLYYSGHGSVLPAWAFPAGLPSLVEGYDKHFGLWTSTRVSLDNFPTYRSELRDGYLTYGICPTDRTAGNMEDCEDRVGAAESLESHYVITDYFINKYWRCSEGSLIYLDACHGSESGAPLPALCTLSDVNASAVVGWSAGVLDQWSTPSAYYFFDRLLGANEFMPVSPRQRPYTVNAVLARMKLVTRRSLPLTQSKSYKGVYLVDTDVPEYVADLLVTYADDTQDLVLRPAIKGLVVYEGSKRIVLDGDFGDVAGSVSLNGSELPLAGDGWTTKRIECTVEKNASGSVVVGLNERQSNPRHLTQWNMTFHQLFMDYPTQQNTDCPSCFYDATIHYTFRGDIGGIRSGLDEDVSPPAFTGGASDADIEVTDAGGSYFIGMGSTITLAPNPDDGAAFIGTCVGYLPTEDNNYLGACFYLNGAESTIAFSPTLSAEGLFRNYTGGSYDGFVDPYQVIYYGNMIDKVLMLSLSPNYTIEAGNQATGPNSYFEWQSADAVSPPDTNDPR